MAPLSPGLLHDEQWWRDCSISLGVARDSGTVRTLNHEAPTYRFVTTKVSILLPLLFRHAPNRVGLSAEIARLARSVRLWWWIFKTNLYQLKLDTGKCLHWCKPKLSIYREFICCLEEPLKQETSRLQYITKTYACILWCTPDVEFIQDRNCQLRQELIFTYNMADKPEIIEALNNSTNLTWHTFPSLWQLFHTN